MIRPIRHRMNRLLVGTALHAVRSFLILGFVLTYEEWPRSRRFTWKLKSDDLPRRLVVTWLLVLSASIMTAYLLGYLLIRPLVKGEWEWAVPRLAWVAIFSFL